MTNVTRVKNFQVKHIDIVSTQTVSLKTDKHTVYQLFNDKKQRIKPSKTVKKGKDLLIYTEDAQEPSVILVDYYQHFTVLDPMELSQLDATFATTSRLVESMPTTITAKATSNTMPMVADTGSSGLGWKVGLGVLGLGAVGAGIASAGRNKDKGQQEQPSSPKPEIKFNTVTQDNIINRQEMESPAIELSGRINHLQTGDVVAIYIGQSRHVVSVKRWSI